MRIEMEGETPIKLWTTSPLGDVPVEDEARAQLRNVARLPFVYQHVAAMPDVHFGMGATVGSVIPTQGAIIPAAVGVDIGCGMMAVRTTLAAERPARRPARAARRDRAAVPHGRTDNGGRDDRGAWGDRRRRVAQAWAALAAGLRARSSSEAPEARPRRVARSSTSARSAPATTSSRSASTRRTASGSCCTAARAASATASAATSSSWRRHDMRALVRQPARPGPRLPPRGHASTSTTTSRRSAGRRSFARANRELMMAGGRRGASREPGCARFEAGDWRR